MQQLEAAQELLHSKEQQGEVPAAAVAQQHWPAHCQGLTLTQLEDRLPVLQEQGTLRVIYLEPGLPACQSISFKTGDGQYSVLGNSLAMVDNSSGYVMVSRAFALARNWRLKACALRVSMADGRTSYIKQVIEGAELTVAQGSPAERTLVVDAYVFDEPAAYDVQHIIGSCTDEGCAEQQLLGAPFISPLQLKVDERRRVAMFEISPAAIGRSSVDLLGALPILDRNAMLRRQEVVQAATARGVDLSSAPVHMLTAADSSDAQPQQQAGAQQQQSASDSWRQSQHR
jgi:hypothetical protein